MARKLKALSEVDSAGWAVVAFYACLPQIFVITALDNFRAPKDAFALAFIPILGAFFLLSRPIWPQRRPETSTLLLGAGLGYLLLHCLLLSDSPFRWSTFWRVLLFVSFLLMLSELTPQWHRRAWFWLSASAALGGWLSVLQSYRLIPMLERHSERMLSGRLTPAGLIGNVDTGGFVFGLAALFCLYPLVVGKRLTWRLLAATLLAANLVGLLATRTLTAFGALTVCLALWLGFHGWWTWRQGATRRHLMIAGTVILAVLLGGYWVGEKTGLVTRIERLGEQIAEGNWARVTSQRQPVFLLTWQMIEQQPMVGGGLGSFAHDFFFFKIDTVSGQPFEVLNRGGSFQQAHNEYLQIWAELGIIGMLLALGLAMLLLWRALRQAFTTKDREHSYWLAVQSLALMFVLISCLAFFPLHVTSAAAVVVLVLASLRRATSAGGFQGRTLTELCGGKPRWVWPARVLVVVLALGALSVPWTVWRANRDLGIVAAVLEEANATQDLRRRRLLAGQAAARLERLGTPSAFQLPEYLSLRGSAAMLMGRYPEAQQYYGRAADLQPSPEFFTNLAAASISARDYGAAKRYLETALSYNPVYKPALEAVAYLDKHH